MRHVGKVAGDSDAHAWVVLELVVPDALEARGEQVADASEHIQIEERVTVRPLGGELMLEVAVGCDLRTEGDGLVLMTEGVEADELVGRRCERLCCSSRWSFACAAGVF